jgi:hypothetical protein
MHDKLTWDEFGLWLVAVSENELIHYCFTTTATVIIISIIKTG